MFKQTNIFEKSEWIDFQNARKNIFKNEGVVRAYIEYLFKFIKHNEIIEIRYTFFIVKV